MAVNVRTSTQDIDIDSAPGIPGLRFRSLGGPHDYPGMVRANMAARTHDGVIEVVTVEGMANNYANLTNSDPHRDVIIAEIAGEIVAYGRVEWADDRDGDRVYQSFCLIDPAWRRRGIGRAMVRWQEARLREIDAEHPSDRPRVFGAFGFDHDPGIAPLLTSEGYSAVRVGHEMLRATLDSIPDAPVAEGLSIRPGRHEEVRPVFEADVEIFRDHWGWVEEGDAAYAKFIGDPNFDPTLWVVAWDGDEIAGLVINVIEPEENRLRGYHRGILASVGVRRGWRQRGLGRALVRESLIALRERGCTSASLGVDGQNENRALHLYETMGFEVVSSSTEYRKPFES